LARFF